MRNSLITGTVNVRTAVSAIRERLPLGWSVEVRFENGKHELTLTAPDGRSAVLVLAVRKGILPRDIPNLLRQADERRECLLLVAPFLSARARELLTEGNASYADTTGNLRVVATSPAIFLEGRGLDRDPTRQPRALKSLKGAAAGRVVRALCDFTPPYGVRTLAKAASSPLSTVSRVVSFLGEEALISRNEGKQIVAVDWPALIYRWAKDYSITKSNTLLSCIEPRGLGALGSKLERLKRFAVTGSLAGPGIASPRLAMIYVDDATTAAEVLEIVPTEAGANVWLLEPFDEVVFERTQNRNFALSPKPVKVVAAAPSQVAVDLLTSPGRGPQEGEALIDKMKGDLHAWRKRP